LPLNLPFYTADVFTNRLFGGNQLAVVPQARDLDDRLMQLLARELNVSETVFVFPPERPAHTRRIRIFTPGTELPFAGHPTIGAAFVLASIAEIPLAGEVTSIVLEEGVGPVRVTIRAEGGRPASCELTVAQLPQFGPPPPPIEEIAAVLSLRPDDIRQDGFAPRGVSCGVPFFVIPLVDERTLARARVNLSVWERSFAKWWAPHLYPIAEAAGRAGADVRARMFAPAMGIVEDPATGGAAAALAGYLAALRAPGTGPLRWTVDQGIEMGRPSRMRVECDREGAQLTAVRVGGTSVMVSEGVVSIP
jgi:trans-2,3-dihydro-3-hydroxyanthranilate isomerase